jgi:hypothetical protein
VLPTDALGSADLTFVVMSDLHYGYGNSVAANQSTIADINALAEMDFPPLVGGGIDRWPRGVCVLGDLTERGSKEQWALFTNDWGSNGEKRVAWPVYEGTGNHDRKRSERTAVTEGIKGRHRARPALSATSDSGLSYSWDWDALHFVHLGTCGAWELPFLAADLEHNVGRSGRPVVLMQHFGWDDFSLRWWSKQEREALFQVIEGYNVIAFFHGHWHEQGHMRWRGIDLYRGGATKDRGVDGGEYLVVHIAGTTMTVLGRSHREGWKNLWQKTIDLGIDQTPPTAPEHLAAESTKRVQVAVSWTASTDPDSGVEHYEVFRNGRQVGTSTTNSFADTGLQAQREHSYQVVAVNGARMRSPPSQIASVWVPLLDEDADGLDDWWELASFGDTATSDGSGDADGDGLGDLDEYEHGADPNNPDTDSDGWSDAEEVSRGTDPRSADVFYETLGPGVELEGVHRRPPRRTASFAASVRLDFDGAVGCSGAPLGPPGLCASLLLALLLMGTTRKRTGRTTGGG